MLGRILCLALLFGAATGAAMAQPTPSASERRQTTERAAADYDKARADYEAVSADPKADVNAMNGAYLRVQRQADNFNRAVRAEVEASPEVQASGGKWQKARKALDEFMALPANKRPFDKEIVLQVAEDEARKAYFGKLDGVAKKVAGEVGGGRAAHLIRTDRHRPLYEQQQAKLRAAEKAEADRKAKAEAEKLKQPRNSSTVKSNCESAGGLAGALNSVACKEQHGG
jgi:hypothetical protein